MSDNRPAALEGVKVLDLTDIKGQFCGKLLASLGAEVIKVEKPGGDAERMLPPFANNEPGLENSLWYASWNANKKSITLDIETKLGQEIFKKLVKDADFVIGIIQSSFRHRQGERLDGTPLRNTPLILEPWQKLTPDFLMICVLKVLKEPTCLCIL